MTEKEFTNLWVEKISKEKLKRFPDDFFSSDAFEVISLPDVQLIMGEELFGSHEILDTKGNSVYMADSYMKAKYIIYSNRFRTSGLKMPIKEEDIASTVKKYDKYLESVVKEIERDFKSKLKESPNFLQVSNDIFHALNLKRY